MGFNRKEKIFGLKRKLEFYFSADKIHDTFTSFIRHVSQPKSVTQPQSPKLGFNWFNVLVLHCWEHS